MRHLRLDLGPLDLNILGLQIDLSRIVLEITAQSGPGIASTPSISVDTRATRNCSRSSADP
jgi:hypothetical protein